MTEYIIRQELDVKVEEGKLSPLEQVVKTLEGMSETKILDKTDRMLLVEYLGQDFLGALGKLPEGISVYDHQWHKLPDDRPKLEG